MAKVAINVEELAAKCGIEIVNCDPAFGGKWAYRKKDSSVTNAGYRTCRSAILAWFKNEFDSEVGEILLRDYIKAV